MKTLVKKGSPTMKDNLQYQFDSLNKIILSNVQTIRDLITQSQSVSDLIEKIGPETGDDVLKENLKDSQKRIQESISKLVQQTEELFDVYSKLLDSCFREK